MLHEKKGPDNEGGVGSEDPLICGITDGKWAEINHYFPGLQSTKGRGISESAQWLTNWGLKWACTQAKMG